MSKILGIIVAITTFLAAYGADQKITVLAIPGQNGQGSFPQEMSMLYGANVRVVPVENSTLVDLGQDWSMEKLDQALKENRDHQNSFIIHASAHGSSTVLNYLAQHTIEECKAVVLESALASGNSALVQAVMGPIIECDFFKHISLVDYLLPYLAIVAYPALLPYSPSGTQAIKSVDRLDTKIPIIIVHSKLDTKIPYSNACALYYALKQKGCNVYFLPQEGDRQVNPLVRIAGYTSDSDKTQGSKNIKIVRNILRLHGISVGLEALAPESTAAACYQPDAEQFKEAYESIMGMEMSHEKIAPVIRLVAMGMIATGMVIWLVFYS